MGKRAINVNQLKIILIAITTIALWIMYCNMILKFEFSSDDAGMVFYSYRLFDGKIKFDITKIGVEYLACYLSFFFHGLSVETLCLMLIIVFLLAIFVAVLVSSYNIRNIYHVLGVGFIWFYMFAPHDPWIIAQGIQYHINEVFVFLLMMICVEKIYVRHINSKLSYLLLFCVILYSFAPFTSLVYILIIVPFLCVVFIKHVEYRMSKNVRESNRELAVAVGTVLISILGTFINRMFDQGMSGTYSGSGIAFSDIDHIITNFRGYIEGIISLFEASIFDKNVFSIGGVYCSIKIFFLLCAILIMQRELKKVIRREKYDVLIVYVSLADLFLSLAYIFGNVYVDILSRRYLTAIVFTIPIVLCRKLCTFDFEFMKDRLMRYETLVAALLVTVIGAKQLPSITLQRTVVTSEDYLSEFLIEHDLEYGYANYWIAGRTSLASGLLVKLVPIGGEYTWEPYYEWALDKDAFFNYVVISKNEVDNVVEIWGDPISKYDISDYYVYVFDYDVRTPSIMVYKANELHTTSGIQTPEEITLTKGTCQYGPYRNFSAGLYSVEVLGKNLDVAKFDCYSSVNNEYYKINLEEVTNDHVKYTVQFDVDTNNIEFRTINEGDLDVTVKKIEVNKISGQ